jgi:hypothetical protein
MSTTKKTDEEEVTENKNIAVASQEARRMLDPESGEEPSVPVSIRLPWSVAYLLNLYAQELNLSAGKVLTSILEDVIPAFEDKNYKEALRIPQVYHLMKEGNLLRFVDPYDFGERMERRLTKDRSSRVKRKS